MAVKKDELFTRAEVQKATGLKEGELSASIKALGIKAGKGGYTYDEVCQILRKPKYKSLRKGNPEKISRLKSQLINDGYTIKASKKEDGQK